MSVFKQSHVCARLRQVSRSSLSFPGRWASIHVLAVSCQIMCSVVSVSSCPKRVVQNVLHRLHFFRPRGSHSQQKAFKESKPEFPKNFTKEKYHQL